MSRLTIIGLLSAGVWVFGSPILLYALYCYLRVPRGSIPTVLDVKLP